MYYRDLTKYRDEQGPIHSLIKEERKRFKNFIKEIEDENINITILNERLRIFIHDCSTVTDVLDRALKEVPLIVYKYENKFLRDLIKLRIEIGE
jgi:predicted site-specific integrase-resolvase